MPYKTDCDSGFSGLTVYRYTSISLNTAVDAFRRGNMTRWNRKTVIDILFKLDTNMGGENLFGKTLPKTVSEMSTYVLLK